MVALDASVWPMPEEAVMAKFWRCRVRLHRWQRMRGPDGQWYRECRDCGTQLMESGQERQTVGLQAAHVRVTRADQNTE